MEQTHTMRLEILMRYCFDPRYFIPRLVMLACLCGLLTLQGCYEWRSPAGGSQSTFSGERPIHTGDVTLPPGYNPADAC
jgi:hypothetical protein